jgi:sulfate-transporting ATPase
VAAVALLNFYARTVAYQLEYAILWRKDLRNMPTTQPKFGPEHYVAGDIILQEGDAADKFYVVVKGEIDIIQENHQGEKVINKLGPRQFFGEIGMLKTSQRTATARAHTDTHLMSMDRVAFNDWLASSDGIQEKINKAIEQRIQADEQDSKAATAPLSQDSDGPQKFAPGTLIVRQGDMADRFYIILEGKVEVVYTAGNGREQLITYLSNGDYFGEIGLLQKGQRITSVRAMTDVRTISFDQEEFVTWMAFYPSQHGIKQTAQKRLRQTVNLVKKNQT